MKKIPALAAIICAASIALAGCGSENGTDNAAQDSSASSSTSAATEANNAEEASSISLADGYCRAKEENSDMTACFGTLTNSSDKDITVESFTAPDLEGASTELHEVVDGQMREKEGGFTIPAGGSQELAPGGEHLMIMNYSAPIQAGDALTFNLVMDDGSELTAEFPVREQPSGEEDYAGGHGDHGDHGDHGGEHDSHEQH